MKMNFIKRLVLKTVERAGYRLEKTDAAKQAPVRKVNQAKASEADPRQAEVDRLYNYPRFTPGTTDILGKRLEFVDSRSLY